MSDAFDHGVAEARGPAVDVGEPTAFDREQAKRELRDKEEADE